VKCPYCNDPAPREDHLWAKWQDGGCRAACFQWDKYTPYLGNLASSDRDDATVFRPRRVQHVRLGKAKA